MAATPDRRRDQMARRERIARVAALGFPDLVNAPIEVVSRIADDLVSEARHVADAVARFLAVPEPTTIPMLAPAASYRRLRIQSQQL